MICAGFVRFVIHRTQRIVSGPTLTAARFTPALVGLTRETLNGDMSSFWGIFFAFVLPRCKADSLRVAAMDRSRQQPQGREGRQAAMAQPPATRAQQHPDASGRSRPALRRWSEGRPPRVDHRRSTPFPSVRARRSQRLPKGCTRRRAPAAVAAAFKGPIDKAPSTQRVLQVWPSQLEWVDQTWDQIYLLPDALIACSSRRRLLRRWVDWRTASPRRLPPKRRRSSMTSLYRR
ncbi:hypothetical protein Esti_002407 [Eimeria stiedai]